MVSGEKRSSRRYDKIEKDAPWWLLYITQSSVHSFNLAFQRMSPPKYLLQAQTPWTE